MTEVVFIGVVVGIVLAVLIYLEIKEYRKAVLAVKGAQALGESMQISLEQISQHMSRFSAIQTALVLDSEERDRQIQSMNLILASHTDALSLKLLTEIAKDVSGD